MEGVIPIYLSFSLHQRTRWDCLLWLQYSQYLFACVDRADAYLSRHPPRTQLLPDEKKKTLVVLGSGWGGTSLLKGLNTENYHVIVVSPRNYFLFTRTPQR
jgi:hypothetical protein